VAFFKTSRILESKLDEHRVDIMECTNCRQILDPSDRFCRSCGLPLQAVSSRALAPSPEQAAAYWRNFFKPFFVAAFSFFGIFFLCSLILVIVWFFMFRN
jgi:hypothetical protein